MDLNSAENFALLSPRMNADDVTSSCGFFNLRRRKYIQYCTIIYASNIHVRNSLLVKYPFLLGVMAISARYKLHSIRVPCWKSVAIFPTSFWPHPFPKACPLLSLYTCTCTRNSNVYYRRRYRHIRSLLHPAHLQNFENVLNSPIWEHRSSAPRIRHKKEKSLW